VVEVVNLDGGCWWQEYPISADAWASWQIGPLDFEAFYGPGEWQFRWRREPDPLVDRVGFSPHARVEPEAEGYEQARYAVRSVSNALRLKPLLADLPMIARPASALHIPANQETVLYVSTVVWLSVLNEGIQLLEMPVYRPSDTWFGSNTIEGEACYSTRTQARTSADALTPLPHRAITPIVIVNATLTTLQIEQLRVPVPFLALHASPDGALWTDRIKLARGLDSDPQEVALELLGADSLPSGCQRLAEPREAAPRHSLVHAFSRLFG